MNIDEELSKAGLTRDQYENAMNDIINKINGVEDMDWAEIRDKYNLNGSGEYLRQAAGKKPFGGAFVYEYFALNNKNHNANLKFSKQLDDIRKERQKLSDERAALRKTSREDARAEENFAVLEELIKKNGKTTFKPVHTRLADSGNDLIVCLSDLHIGMIAESQFGRYDSQIAKERLDNYLEEIVNIQKIHKSQNVYLFMLGDVINGNIHPTVQLENRENVVEQIQLAGEYLSAFTYELTKYFKNVYVSDVPGNHSRIGLKDNVLRNERLDDLIVWYMKAKLEHLKNVIFFNDQYDSTISSMTIRSKEYLLVHGDYDAFSENGLNKLCMFIGHVPTGGVFCGHLHHCSFDDISDVKMIRSGSFAGTCDNYTIQKRLYSRPSQMVCVVNDRGIQAMYPVVLS